MNFSTFTASGIIEKITSAFSSQLQAATDGNGDPIFDSSADYDSGVLKATSVASTIKFKVRVEHNDSYGDGSNAHKNLELYLPDGSILGMVSIDYNTWSGPDGNQQSNEGYNITSSDQKWLGNGNVNSDGFINESIRVDYAANASGRNANYTDYYMDADENTAATDGTALPYYNELRKNGKIDDQGNITWQRVESWDYVSRIHQITLECSLVGTKLMAQPRWSGTKIGINYLNLLMRPHCN